MPQRFDVKTSPSSWTQIRNFFVKTSASSWAAVTDAWVKVSSTSWRQFWSALMNPSQAVEIEGTYGGYNNDTLRLRGKNYVWSPTPQSLRYYFREVSNIGTFYIGPGGSSGATATNTISFYPSSTTFVTIDPEGTDYNVGALTQYFFEVRATGASGTVYSSISSNSIPQIASPLAPTLSVQSTTSTSATIRITAAADTTGAGGFSSWAATYRYIVYTYDNVGGTIYTGGGRGGIAATSSSQDITLTGLVAGRQYTVYVLPTTGTAGSRPFPYNASTQTNGYSGYPGVEASIQVTTASPPTIVTNPTFTLQSGTANTVNSVYRLTSGTWNGTPTEYRYEVGRNDISGTVLAYFPSSTTWTTNTFYDHTFTATTGTNTVYGSVIARNANGQSTPAYAQETVGPIIASPQSTGQQRRVNLPSNFTSGTTVYISTNGFIGIGADPSGSISLPTSGLYLSPLQGDQRQTALWTYADSSNFYVRWQGARYNDAAQTIDYQAKFYWNSTAVDVYFVTNNLSSSNPASTTAVYNNGSETVNWSSSSSQSSSLISTSSMTRNTTQDTQDDARTAITASALTIPGAPTNVFSSNITSTGARINWSAPSSDGGSSIIRYELNRDGGGFFSVGNVFLYDYFISVAGTYTIGVRAVNSIGAGPASYISVTIPTASNRTAPSIFNVIKSGSNFLVYFSGGTTGGAYQVWWQSSSSTPSTCGPGDAQGTSSPVTVSNLTPGAGSTYYFFVRSTSATNTTDCGPSTTASAWSSGYAYTEPSVNPPATPTGVSVSGSGVVTWTHPGADTFTIEFYTATNGSGANAAGPYTQSTTNNGSYQLVSPYASPNNWARARVRANTGGLSSSYSAFFPADGTYV